MIVTFVRHTRPAVSRKICYGRTDIELADTFEQEAEVVVAALPDADVLITSPLARCRRLATFIGRVRRLQPQIDERVREMDFGRWERLPWNDIPRAELDTWASDFMHARPHGGESVAMLRDRTHSALNEYRQSGRRYIVVTHAGVIKAALASGDKAVNWNTNVDFGGSVQV